MGALAGAFKRHDFGVRATKALVPSFRNDFVADGDQATDHRVRFDGTAPERSQLQRSSHASPVNIAHGHQRRIQLQTRIDWFNFEFAWRTAFPGRR
jgi:hypothetical protein